MSAFTFSRSIMPKAAVACTFDVATKKGQTVEVMYNPYNLNLSNIEYQSLPVGGHHLESDIILFTVSHSASSDIQSTIYPCLAFFSRAKLPSSAKPAFRGYSMKSVSLVFPPHTTVQYMYLYRKALEDRITEIHEWDLCENNERDAKKSSMKSWMMRLVEAEGEFQDPITFEMGENEEISRGLEQFMSTMSSNLIVLWKYLTLGKRVLLLSNAENQFKYLNVYYASLLSSSSMSLFGISVTDIPYLSTQKSYIAVTTEKIFAEKSDLWDILIRDDGSIRQSMNVMIRLTKQDKLMFKKLNSIVHSNPSSDSDFNFDPRSTDSSNRLCCHLSSVFSAFCFRLECVAPPPSSPDSSIQHLVGKSQFTATTSSASALTMFSRFFDSLNTRLTHNLDEAIQTGVFTIDQFKRVGISDSDTALVEELLKIKLEYQRGRCESQKGKEGENVCADREIKVEVERRLSMWRKLIGLIICCFGSIKKRSSKVKAL